MNAPARRSRLPIGIRAWPLRAALAVVVLVIIGYFFYRATGATPDERNRVTHSGGYSIVVPRGWAAVRETTMFAPPTRDRLLLEPDEWRGRKPTIWAKRLTEAPTEKLLDGYTAGRFQGEPARVREQARRNSTTRTAFIERAGTWYEIGVELPGLEAAKIEDWWRFAETFRAASVEPTSRSSA